ncbi:MAG TPA: abortive infection system antitoxin AbiGi family protein [Coxiellaceae bacterium]|nr:abortive infection system antitoxin AbiGi family protein [Coxiellaceae bacterium]
MTQRYISNYLHHFISRQHQKNDEENFKILKAILTPISDNNTYWLCATGPEKKPNAKVTYDRPYRVNKFGELGDIKAVCFCDIPLNKDLAIHMNKFGKFGISFKKDFLVKQGVRPVTYIPEGGLVQRNQNKTLTVKDKHKDTDKDKRLKINKDTKKYKDIIEYFLNRHDGLDELLNLLDQIAINQQVEGIRDTLKNHISLIRNMLEIHILGYTIVFNPNMDDHDLNNYYFEREWRVVGNVAFTINNVGYFIVPTYHYRSELISHLKTTNVDVSNRILTFEEFEKWPQL